MRKVKAPSFHLNIVNDPAVSYEVTDDRRMYNLIELVRNGVPFKQFKALWDATSFTLQEWASYLHISERTIQRYETENKSFDPTQSEKILQIAMLYRYGNAVFGDESSFSQWLQANNLALGGVQPKQLLDSSFGIELIKDELGRIEHGVLA